MINASQIRAARGLLDWTRDQLAAASGVSVPALSKIETAKSNPHPETLSKVQGALEQAGILFTDNSGVKLKSDIVTILEGEESYLKLLHFIQGIMAGDPEEILFSFCDDRRSTKEVITKTKVLRQLGIPMRFLVEDGNTYIMGPLKEYRWVDKRIFVDSDVKLIFKDYVAYLITWQNRQKILVLNDRNIAAEARKYFEYFWTNSRMPSESTAEEVY